MVAVLRRCETTQRILTDEAASFFFSLRFRGFFAFGAFALWLYIFWLSLHIYFALWLYVYFLALAILFLPFTIYYILRFGYIFSNEFRMWRGQREGTWKGEGCGGGNGENQ